MRLSTSNQLYHQVLDLSDRRNVYAVGDIHGEFPLLQEELDKLGFDGEEDALVSVGDLIDRGPNSEDAFKWIEYDWFHRSLGNHEEFPRLYLEDVYTKDQLEGAGCQWFLSKPRPEIARLGLILEDAPHALTVKTPGGKSIGIAHADCSRDWTTYIAMLDKIWVRDMTLQSRETVKELFEVADKKRELDVERFRVANIDHVVHGHSVIGRPFTVANRTWIDTGACMGGDLTIVNLDTL